jgi:putative DNA primase/helicase
MTNIYAKKQTEDEGAAALPQSPRFHALARGYKSPADLLHASSRPWLVKKLIREGACVVLYGKPGSCKSFLAQHLAFGIATGTEAWGQPIAPGAVVYLAGGEGNDGLRSRCLAWEKATGQSLLNAPLVFREDAVNLRDAQAVERVVAEAAGVVAPSGKAIRLVVVDTLSRNFGGGDENSQGPMSELVRGIDAIRQAFRCAVVVVHHVSRSGNGAPRGSTVLEGAADTMLEVASQDDGTVRMTIEKQKDGRDDIALAFEQVSIDVGLDADGDPVESLHLRFSAQQSGARPATASVRSPTQQRVLDTLRAAGPAGLSVDQLAGELPPDITAGTRGRRTLTDAIRTLRERTPPLVVALPDGNVRLAP